MAHYLGLQRTGVSRITKDRCSNVTKHLICTPRIIFDTWYLDGWLSLVTGRRVFCKQGDFVWQKTLGFLNCFILILDTISRKVFQVYLKAFNYKYEYSTFTIAQISKQITEESISILSSTFVYDSIFDINMCCKVARYTPVHRINSVMLSF